MKDELAQEILTSVMGWRDIEVVRNTVRELQLLGQYKYDHYQRFAPGRHFIESLALWLRQFQTELHRQAALDLILDHLVFVSEAEMSHLVSMAYPDIIVHERLKMVALERGVPRHNVARLKADPRFKELAQKSLYLGLSDGARTSELRRASKNQISNEQIWQAYELGEEKVAKLREKLQEELGVSDSGKARFNLVWLLEDFSGSGFTYIRFDGKRFKGKLPAIFRQLTSSELVDTSHYEVFLLLYMATRQAIDHIEYWSERFTSEEGYKPLQIRVIHVLESDVAMTEMPPHIRELVDFPDYYDEDVHDVHMRVGGTSDSRRGFAGCALPLALAHNAPNNSLYLIWAPEEFSPNGLFPRVSRHREF